ncbi:hypothetical protein KIPB_000973, partial [Kipferlia bialata]
WTEFLSECWAQYPLLSFLPVQKAFALGLCLSDPAAEADTVLPLLRSIMEIPLSLKGSAKSACSFIPLGFDTSDPPSLLSTSPQVGEGERQGESLCVVRETVRRVRLTSIGYEERHESEGEAEVDSLSLLHQIGPFTWMYQRVGEWLQRSFGTAKSAKKMRTALSLPGKAYLPLLKTAQFMKKPLATYRSEGQPQFFLRLPDLKGSSPRSGNASRPVYSSQQQLVSALVLLLGYRPLDCQIMYCSESTGVTELRRMVHASRNSCRRMVLIKPDLLPVRLVRELEVLQRGLKDTPPPQAAIPATIPPKFKDLLTGMDSTCGKLCYICGADRTDQMGGVEESLPRPTVFTENEKDVNLRHFDKSREVFIQSVSVHTVLGDPQCGKTHFIRQHIQQKVAGSRPTSAAPSCPGTPTVSTLTRGIGESESNQSAGGDSSTRLFVNETLTHCGAIHALSQALPSISLDSDLCVHFDVSPYSHVFLLHSILTRLLLTGSVSDPNGVFTFSPSFCSPSNQDNRLNLYLEMNSAYPEAPAVDSVPSDLVQHYAVPLYASEGERRTYSPTKIFDTFLPCLQLVYGSTVSQANKEKAGKKRFADQRLLTQLPPLSPIMPLVPEHKAVFTACDRLLDLSQRLHDRREKTSHIRQEVASILGGEGEGETQKSEDGETPFPQLSAFLFPDDTEGVDRVLPNMGSFSMFVDVLAAYLRSIVQVDAVYTVHGLFHALVDVSVSLALASVTGSELSFRLFFVSEQGAHIREQQREREGGVERDGSRDMRGMPSISPSFSLSSLSHSFFSTPSLSRNPSKGKTSGTPPALLRPALVQLTQDAECIPEVLRKYLEECVIEGDRDLSASSHGILALLSPGRPKNDQCVMHFNLGQGEAQDVILLRLVSSLCSKSERYVTKVLEKYQYCLTVPHVLAILDSIGGGASLSSAGPLTPPTPMAGRERVEEVSPIATLHSGRAPCGRVSYGHTGTGKSSLHLILAELMRPEKSVNIASVMSTLSLSLARTVIGTEAERERDGSGEAWVVPGIHTQHSVPKESERGEEKGKGAEAMRVFRVKLPLLAYPSDEHGEGEGESTLVQPCFEICLTEKAVGVRTADKKGKKGTKYSYRQSLTSGAMQDLDSGHLLEIISFAGNHFLSQLAGNESLDVPEILRGRARTHPPLSPATLSLYCIVPKRGMLPRPADTRSEVLAVGVSSDGRESSQRDTSMDETSGSLERGHLGSTSIVQAYVYDGDRAIPLCDMLCTMCATGDKKIPKFRSGVAAERVLRSNETTVLHVMPRFELLKPRHSIDHEFSPGSTSETGCGCTSSAAHSPLSALLSSFIAGTPDAGHNPHLHFSRLLDTPATSEAAFDELCRALDSLSEPSGTGSVLSNIGSTLDALAKQFHSARDLSGAPETELGRELLLQLCASAVVPRYFHMCLDAGFSGHTLTRKLAVFNQLASLYDQIPLTLFLDEVNCVFKPGAMKHLILDRCFNGESLSPSVSVVGAVNLGPGALSGSFQSTDKVDTQIGGPRTKSLTLNRPLSLSKRKTGSRAGSRAGTPGTRPLSLGSAVGTGGTGGFGADLFAALPFDEAFDDVYAVCPLSASLKVIARPFPEFTVSLAATFVQSLLRSYQNESRRHFGVKSQGMSDALSALAQVLEKDRERDRDPSVLHAPEGVLRGDTPDDDSAAVVSDDDLFSVPPLTSVITGLISECFRFLKGSSRRILSIRSISRCIAIAAHLRLTLPALDPQPVDTPKSDSFTVTVGERERDRTVEAFFLACLVEFGLGLVPSEYDRLVSALCATKVDGRPVRDHPSAMNISPSGADALFQCVYAGVGVTVPQGMVLTPRHRMAVVALSLSRDVDEFPVLLVGHEGKSLAWSLFTSSTSCAESSASRSPCIYPLPESIPDPLSVRDVISHFISGDGCVSAAQEERQTDRPLLLLEGAEAVPTGVFREVCSTFDSFLTVTSHTPLDPTVQNRMLVVYMPQPSEADLRNTLEANGMTPVDSLMTRYSGLVTASHCLSLVDVAERVPASASPGSLSDLLAYVQHPNVPQPRPAVLVDTSANVSLFDVLSVCQRDSPLRQHHPFIGSAFDLDAHSAPLKRVYECIKGGTPYITVESSVASPLAALQASLIANPSLKVLSGREEWGSPYGSRSDGETDTPSVMILAEPPSERETHRYRMFSAGISDATALLLASMPAPVAIVAKHALSAWRGFVDTFSEGTFCGCCDDTLDSLLLCCYRDVSGVFSPGSNAPSLSDINMSQDDIMRHFVFPHLNMGGDTGDGTYFEVLATYPSLILPTSEEVPCEVSEAGSRLAVRGVVELLTLLVPDALLIGDPDAESGEEVIASAQNQLGSALLQLYLSSYSHYGVSSILRDLLVSNHSAMDTTETVFSPFETDKSPNSPTRLNIITPRQTDPTSMSPADVRRSMYANPVLKAFFRSMSGSSKEERVSVMYLTSDLSAATVERYVSQWLDSACEGEADSLPQCLVWMCDLAEIEPAHVRTLRRIIDQAVSSRLADGSNLSSAYVVCVAFTPNDDAGDTSERDGEGEGEEERETLDVMFHRDWRTVFTSDSFDSLPTPGIPVAKLLQTVLKQRQDALDGSTQTKTEDTHLRVDRIVSLNLPYVVDKLPIAKYRSQCTVSTSILVQPDPYAAVLAAVQLPCVRGALTRVLTGLIGNTPFGDLIRDHVDERKSHLMPLASALHSLQTGVVLFLTLAVHALLETGDLDALVEFHHNVTPSTDMGHTSMVYSPTICSSDNHRQLGVIEDMLGCLIQHHVIKNHTSLLGLRHSVTNITDGHPLLRPIALAVLPPYPGIGMLYDMIAEVNKQSGLLVPADILAAYIDSPTPPEDTDSEAGEGGSEIDAVLERVMVVVAKVSSIVGMDNLHAILSLPGFDDFSLEYVARRTLLPEMFAEVEATQMEMGPMEPRPLSRPLMYLSQVLRWHLTFSPLSVLQSVSYRPVQPGTAVQVEDAKTLQLRAVHCSNLFLAHGLFSWERHPYSAVCEVLRDLDLLSPIYSTSSPLETDGEDSPLSPTQSIGDVPANPSLSAAEMIIHTLSEAIPHIAGDSHRLGLWVRISARLLDTLRWMGIFTDTDSVHGDRIPLAESRRVVAIQQARALITASLAASEYSTLVRPVEMPGRNVETPASVAAALTSLHSYLVGTGEMLAPHVPKEWGRIMRRAMEETGSWHLGLVLSTLFSLDLTGDLYMGAAQKMLNTLQDCVPLSSSSATLTAIFCLFNGIYDFEDVVVKPLPVQFCTTFLAKLCPGLADLSRDALVSVIALSVTDQLQESMAGVGGKCVTDSGVPMSYNSLTALLMLHKAQLRKVVEDTPMEGLTILGQIVQNHTAEGPSNVHSSEMQVVVNAYVKCVVPFLVGVLVGTAKGNDTMLRTICSRSAVVTFAQLSRQACVHFVAGVAELCGHSSDDASAYLLEDKKLYVTFTRVSQLLGSISIGAESRTPTFLPAYMCNVGSQLERQWESFYRAVKGCETAKQIREAGRDQRKGGLTAEHLRMFMATIAAYCLYDESPSHHVQFGIPAFIAAVDLFNDEINHYEGLQIKFLADPQSHCPIYDTPDILPYSDRTVVFAKEIFPPTSQHPNDYVDHKSDNHGNVVLRYVVTNVGIASLGLPRSKHWLNVWTQQYHQMGGHYPLGHSWSSACGTGIHLDCGMKDGRFSDMTVDAFKVRAMDPKATRMSWLATYAAVIFAMLTMPGGFKPATESDNILSTKSTLGMGRLVYCQAQVGNCVSVFQEIMRCTEAKAMSYISCAMEQLVVNDTPLCNNEWSHPTQNLRDTLEREFKTDISDPAYERTNSHHVLMVQRTAVAMEGESDRMSFDAPSIGGEPMRDSYVSEDLTALHATETGAAMSFVIENEELLRNAGRCVRYALELRARLSYTLRHRLYQRHLTCSVPQLCRAMARVHAHRGTAKAIERVFDQFLEAYMDTRPHMRVVENDCAENQLPEVTKDYPLMSLIAFDGKGRGRGGDAYAVIDEVISGHLSILRQLSPLIDSALGSLHPDRTRAGEREGEGMGEREREYTHWPAPRTMEVGGRNAELIELAIPDCLREAKSVYLEPRIAKKKKMTGRERCTCWASSLAFTLLLGPLQAVPGDIESRLNEVETVEYHLSLRGTDQYSEVLESMPEDE